MNAAHLWGGAGVTSLAAHLGAGLLIAAMIQPHPVTDQPPPKSELRIETQQVARSNAAAQAPNAPQAATASAKGADLSPGTVPVSRATPATPRPDRLRPKPAAPATTPTAPTPPATPASVPPTTTLAATPATAPQAQPLAAPPATPAIAPPTTSLTADAAPPATPAQSPTAQSLPQARTTPDQLAPTPPKADRMAATLAFAGPDAQIDPVSVAAIASLMTQGDPTARSDTPRDALTALLTSLPCARLQAEFNPQTGSLDLRGHIPDPAMKGPVLAALQAQLGSAITVNDAMLILPRPQCGALSGIADVGLPQSQDQNTNPRLIGDDAQARAYDYTAGQTLVLDLAAPDYDAYLYVDYFVADGTVIHLVPNDTVPLRLRPAKSALRVGAPDADEPFLNITIGPPYGQEIAAAFAASAPLYDGTRPLSEPAAPYLEFLKTRVAAARAANPAFKGEWVYFFVSTRE